MKMINKIFLFTLVLFVISSCKSKEDEVPQISPIDISEEIIGEWVLDNLSDGTWQSMKFKKNGNFYYSENKDEWTSVLKRTDGRYYLDGMNVSGSYANGSVYVDMTIKEINGYSFTTRFKNTAVDFTYNKVLMRTHLNFAESVTPPYSELIDKPAISYKSHDEKIATVDPNTGEITATGSNGRTYIDVTTNEGTACIKVMVGTVNDGDLDEVSTIPTQKENVHIEEIDVAAIIVDKLWVYDHPEESVWEIIRFMKSGKLYYSNKTEDWGVENENTNGTYEIDQKTIKGKVMLFGTVPMDFHWVVTNITNLEFTVKCYSSGAYVGQFTYSQQVDAVEMNVGESLKPDYQKLVGDATIKGYKSHDTSCLTIDNETGEIVAVKNGHTYIDIITNEGTAVISANVLGPKSFWNMNYEDFLGTKWNVVANTFGTAFTDDGQLRYYDYSEGSLNARLNTILEENWSMLAFHFDPDQNTGSVKAIYLMQNANAWFSVEDMAQYLSEKYYVYEKGTEETFKAYINNEDFEKATVGITWDMDNKLLSFVQISHSTPLPVFDYGRYMGKTRDEVKETMKSETGLQPSSDTDNSLIYRFDNDKINAVVFFFRSTENVLEINVRLNPNIDKDLVKDELGKNYTQLDSTNDYIWYQSSDGKMRVDYQVTSNIIVFKWK